MVDQTQVEVVDVPTSDGHVEGRRPLVTATQVFGGLVFSFVWALLCTLTIDFWQTGGSISRIVDYELGVMRLILLVSTVVVWALLLLLIAVTNRLFLSCGLLMATATVVGLANYQKLQLRREPIYPSDLTFVRHAGFLGDMVSPRLLITGVAGALLMVLIAGRVGRLAGRRFPRPSRQRENYLWRTWTGVRVVVIVITVAFLLSLQSFNDPDNKVRHAYEKAGAHWAFWFQEVNYSRHGFVAGFLYNMPVPAMRPPPGYSESRMQAIAARYATSSSHDSISGDAREPISLVLVLSEAFSDPERIDGVSLGEDPIPATRELMRSTTSGNMLAQLFGGGTANIEFELLTGQSLSQFLPQLSTPYQMLVPNQPSYPSVVGYLKGQGADALAIHPYMTTMYKRYAVYPKLGLDPFVHDATMHSQAKIDEGEFISDAAAYEEVLLRLRGANRPSLVNLITMQNHYPMKGQYRDPFKVTGVSGEEREQLAHYARGLKHTDDATAAFLDRLRESDKRTAVVFYGDHLPAFWSKETIDDNDPLTMRQTPYFMWSNYKQLRARHERLTSPIYFLPLLWKELGLPLPPYYELLLKLHAEIPAMEQGEYYLPDGRKVSEDELPPRAKSVLADYRLVQYDFSIGRRYAVEKMFPQAG